MNKGLINRLDIVWSKLIKLKDGLKCKVCGRTDGLSSHHIHGRGKLSTRWDLDNGLTLCDEHHTKSGDFSAHLTPEKFKIWLKKEIGLEAYEDLEQRANKAYHWTDPELREMIKIMNKTLKNIYKLL